MLNLSGLKFGRLIAKNIVGLTKDKRCLWLCVCDCGNTKICTSKNLKDGCTKSCGCLKKETDIKNGKANKKHGYKGTRTYNIWRDMLDRCKNEKNISYKNYGGRGIKVCDRWDISEGGSFENFIKDMGEIPKGLTIDRIDNNGNYCPENCKLSTRKQQSRNTRKNHLITFGGKTQCLSAWAEEYNICLQTLWYRIKRGLSIKDAINIRKDNYE